MHVCVHVMHEVASRDKTLGPGGPLGPRAPTAPSWPAGHC